MRRGQPAWQGLQAVERWRGAGRERGYQENSIEVMTENKPPDERLKRGKPGSQP